MLFTQAVKWKSVLDNARRANEIMTEKFEENREMISFLEKPFPEIHKAIKVTGEHTMPVQAVESQVREKGKNVGQVAMIIIIVDDAVCTKS